MNNTFFEIKRSSLFKGNEQVKYPWLSEFQTWLKYTDFHRVFKCLRPLWPSVSLVISPDPDQRQMDLCFLNNFFLKSKWQCLLYENTRKTPKVQMNEHIRFSKNTNYIHYLESSCHESQNTVLPWWHTMEINHHSGKALWRRNQTFLTSSSLTGKRNK